MSENCAICFEPLASGGSTCETLECRHVYHKACVDDLRRSAASGICPLCRAPVDLTSEVVPPPPKPATEPASAPHEDPLLFFSCAAPRAVV